MANNRLPVFLPLTKSSPEFPALPPHRVSPTRAALLVRINWAKYVQPKNPRLGIVLIFAMTWAEVKNQLFRVNTTRPVTVPKILPPHEPEPIVLSYPRMGQETDARERQAALWMNATRF